MKKTVKFLGIMMAAIIAMTALSSCGKSDEENMSEASSAFTEIMDAFKAGDIAEIEKYTELGDDEALSAALLASLSNFEWSDAVFTPNGSNSVTVDANITVLDPSQIMQKYVTGIAALVSSPEYQSQIDTMTKEDYNELMNGQLISILESGEIPTVTESISVDMVKNGGVWQLKDSRLPDRLIGNTLSAIKQIKQ